MIFADSAHPPYSFDPFSRFITKHDSWELHHRPSENTTGCTAPIIEALMFQNSVTQPQQIETSGWTDSYSITKIVHLKYNHCDTIHSLLATCMDIVILCQPLSRPRLLNFVFFFFCTNNWFLKKANQLHHGFDFDL